MLLLPKITSVTTVNCAEDMVLSQYVTPDFPCWLTEVLVVKTVAYCDRVCCDWELLITCGLLSNKYTIPLPKKKWNGSWVKVKEYAQFHFWIACGILQVYQALCIVLVSVILSCFALYREYSPVGVSGECNTQGMLPFLVEWRNFMLQWTEM